MGAFKDRTGEVRRMNSGLVCKVIVYRSNKDIDVMFEDGTVKRHVSYGSFCKGSVSKNVYGSGGGSVGEVRVMNNGQSCEIIQYNNNSDITVRFSDGSIREHVRYSCFVRGVVAKTSRAGDIRESRVGEVIVTNEGYTCELIEYNKYTDVTVRFEDGTVLDKVHYDSFSSGIISKDSFRAKGYRDKVSKERLGCEKVMGCGLLCKVIEYRNTSDMTVQFEDGTIIEHVAWKSFRNGELRHPKRGLRIGSVKYITDELYMRVLNIHKTGCIDIEFNDGRVALRCNRQSFCNGTTTYRRVLTPAYTLNGVRYYTCEYRGVRYLGTIEEIRAEICK